MPKERSLIHTSMELRRQTFILGKARFGLKRGVSNRSLDTLWILTQKKVHSHSRNFLYSLRMFTLSLPAAEYLNVLTAAGKWISDRLGPFLKDSLGKKKFGAQNYIIP